jgi:2-hydroxychromene-2-carboxylate isomerase
MGDTRVIEIFFDIGSSYSYLAATQMERASAETGLAVRWRPFLLGGVFKATGNEMPAKLPAKARYMLEDMDRWSTDYGVPFRMPSRFPVITLRTQRALAAIEGMDPAKVAPAALCLFRGYWGEDRDPTTDEEIGKAAGVAGLDPAAVIAAIDLQQTKDRLRATTDEAVRRGAFGAPALYVGDMMFWGNDRLDLLVRTVKRT